VNGLDRYTVVFTGRLERKVFDYLFSQVKKGSFSDISEATNSLLKEAIRRRRKNEQR